MKITSYVFMFTLKCLPKGKGGLPRYEGRRRKGPQPEGGWGLGEA